MNEYDGRGYPCGLKGEEIPEIAAIIGVADAYDADLQSAATERCFHKMLLEMKYQKGSAHNFTQNGEKSCSN